MKIFTTAFCFGLLFLGLMGCEPLGILLNAASSAPPAFYVLIPIDSRSAIEFEDMAWGKYFYMRDDAWVQTPWMMA